MAQRVLVTAGANGIGLAIARAFAGGGAQVAVCDIDEAGLEAARAAIPGLTALRCDVADRAQAGAMVDEAVGALGGLDVLVNNAGIGGPTAPLHRMDPDDWDRVLAVNLTGTFDVTRAAIPHLIAAGRGVILIMSSAAGRFGYPGRSPYAVSKWGLIGLTRTLSMELGEHAIRVNAIAPGAVDGNRIRRVFQGRAEATGTSLAEIERMSMANQSIRRLVDPDEIGSLAVFLASDAARSISGQVVPIDGDHQRN